MRSKIKISVVIPSYNAHDTILICLRSVLDQSESVDEIIIVDDESTDGTLELLEKELKELNLCDRVILLPQKNQGPSAARNNGVAIAKSNFIAFLDSDDQWTVDHIKYCKTFLSENTSYKFVASKYKNVPHTYTGQVTFKMMLIKNYLSTPCVIIDKQCFLECGGFNKKMHYSEDYYLWLNLVYSNKLYKLNFFGASNIINKRSFGDVGLSSNLTQMHKGVLKCYQNLYQSNKIKLGYYWVLRILEHIKYLRRIILTRIYSPK